MTLDWLEILSALAVAILGGGLMWRRGRRQVAAIETVAEATPIPPAERYDHAGSIEETERARAEDAAEVASDPRPAGDRWRDF